MALSLSVAPSSVEEAHVRAVALAHALRLGEATAVAAAAPPGAARSFALHLGSSRPHAADGDAEQWQRRDSWAPRGSLRQLEPERPDVLRVEAMPLTNVPKRTDPEDAPRRHDRPPGPFTTAQLIPAKCHGEVVHHGRVVAGLLSRARGSKGGAHAACKQRPEPLIYEEHEALNECGWGYTWRKRPHEDLWDVVQPSSWPDDPPDGALAVENFRALAAKEGLTDHQVISWVGHGFPGARGMPTGRAVVAYPHAGAMHNAAAFAAANAKDIAAGFVSSGAAFPEIWPTVVDPMNIVLQHGSARCTIDKTMQLASRDHPEPVPAYNDYIDLEEERAEVGRLTLVRVSSLSRASAILATAGVRVVGGKFDLRSYFRMHAKQRLHVYQSGRLFETLFGVDWRVNFGERDAPDHTCRASDALAFFVRKELRRLDQQYPSRVGSVVAWLADRLGASGGVDDPHFQWQVMFFFCYYVDDAGIAILDDELFDAQGRQVFVLDGGARRPRLRSEMYFEAAMAIVNYVGHDTPEKKQSLPALDLVFLGVTFDYTRRMLFLERAKRNDYAALVASVVRESPVLPSKSKAAAYADFNSMVHKLLHACEVIPLMRPHMFHTRAALKVANRAYKQSQAEATPASAARRSHRLERPAVVFGAHVSRELEWCIAQLEKSEEHGVPFASRFDFPGFEEGTVVRYTDASREPDKPLSASGFGGWSIVDGEFVYAHGSWTPAEVARFSINVLEAKARDMVGRAIVEHAMAKATVTHTLAYVDNTSAQFVSENGRTESAAMNQLNERRHAWLVQNGVHEATERVASVDNDVADLLSRGDVDEALRFARWHRLPAVRLGVEAHRDTSELAPTWP